MDKKEIKELASFGLTISKNIPMPVDTDDEDRETLKQLPENCASKPKIRIRIK